MWSKLTFLTPRSKPCPVAKVALSRVVPLQHVAVTTLELAHHPVLQVGGHHHPVPRSIRELCALSRDTLGQIGPSTIVTNTADIVTGLELGDTRDFN